MNTKYMEYSGSSAHSEIQISKPYIKKESFKSMT